MKKLLVLATFTLHLVLWGAAAETGPTMTEEKPRYLYKILSDRLWEKSLQGRDVITSADDAPFIHFSREDQLDRIISKYWGEADRYVVLKIEAGKLEGELVFEENPGGVTKYYHLYGGKIPLSSIAEAKIVYCKPLEGGLVDVVQIGDPVLRRVARELTVEEILSPEIQALIETMKVTMRKAPGVGLAAPQIGRSIQLVVIEDMEHSHLSAEKMAELGVADVPFHVVINPKIYLEEGKETHFFEACISVDGLVGIVPRALSVRVECLNEKAEPVVIHATGWYARILQHEIDHLNGVLYLDRAHLATLMTYDTYTTQWRGRPISEIMAALMPQDAPVCR